MPLLVVLAALGAWLTVRTVRRHRASGPPPELGPVGWATGIRWRTLAPLARFENRRLVRHPLFLTGVALTPVMLWAATLVDFAKVGEPWRILSPSIALALVPLGWFTIVAVNLLLLQPPRSGAAELFAALPAPQPVRTAGALATMATATTAAAVLATAWVAALSTRDDLIGRPQWGEIGAGVLVVAGAVTVGVAVGRWLRFAAFGIVGAVAVSIIQARFLDDRTWPWNRRHSHPLRFLGFLAEPTAVGDAALEIRPTWWHLVYLAALIALMCAVALSRDGVPRRLGAALIAAVGVVSIVGWAQTRPPSTDQTDAMVGYITQPAEHQICERRGHVRFCAYQPWRYQIDEWDARVQGVLALVLEPLRHGRSRCCSEFRRRSATPPANPSRSSRASPSRSPIVSRHKPCGPTTGTSIPSSATARSRAAIARPTGCSRPCRPARGLSICHQHPITTIGAARPTDKARAVVALWLAAAATPDGADLLRDLSSEAASPTGDLTFEGWDGPPMWGTSYTASDAALAVAMAERRRASEIAELLGDDGRWIDPATSSTDLATRLELPVPATSRTSGTCT